LSNISNGTLALLAYRFLFLLRSLQCPTITGLIMTYWCKISKHRRDPKHITIDLPWKFKDVYEDLISSGISTLSVPIDHTTVTPTAFAARSSSQPFATLKTKSVPKSDPATMTIGIHRTKDGRKFVSHNNALSTVRHPTCSLCNNKHVNPWHDTDNCPLKHPMYILPKDTRERVMQHNALHGAEKTNYTKDQDLPTQTSMPPQAASALTTPIIESPTEDIEHPPDEDDEIVETEYFDLPPQHPIANCATFSETPPFQDLESNTLISNTLEYIAYDS
jgi:hypothetical protein